PCRLLLEQAGPWWAAMAYPERYKLLREALDRAFTEDSSLASIALRCLKARKGLEARRLTAPPETQTSAKTGPDDPWLATASLTQLAELLSSPQGPDWSQLRSATSQEKDRAAQAVAHGQLPEVARR